VQHSDGIAVLAVAGEIDLATAPALEEAITSALANDPTALVIELSAVTFMASAGMQILATTQEKVSKSAQFAVVADSPATSIPIQLTGLDEIFSLYPTLDEALTAVRAEVD
jgi:anti-anti-sigma factor